MANSKRHLFLKRRMRVRNKLRKVNAGRVRLSVHRSNKNISCQLIDDVKGLTLAAASSMENDLGVVGKNNIEACTKVGVELAKRAKSAGMLCTEAAERKECSREIWRTMERLEG